MGEPGRLPSMGSHRVRNDWSDLAAAMWKTGVRSLGWEDPGSLVGESHGQRSLVSYSLWSDSVWPHRQQPTRLPHPWDSPGKNTGVGCHFLLQCMKVKGENEVAQSCPTLCDPMNCSLPGCSTHGIFQARVLDWGVIAFSSQLLGLNQIQDKALIVFNSPTIK